MERTYLNTSENPLLTGTDKPPPIRAAGGLLWRETEHGKELVVIHRTRYDDWSLPKGKLKPGERWEEAALREVAEETGYWPALESFAGASFYYDKNRPKIVLYWNMRLSEAAPFEEVRLDSPDETDQVLWLPVPEALERMNYASEKEIVRNEAR